MRLTEIFCFEVSEYLFGDQSLNPLGFLRHAISQGSSTFRNSLVANQHIDSAGKDRDVDADFVNSRRSSTN